MRNANASSSKATTMPISRLVFLRSWLYMVWYALATYLSDVPQMPVMALVAGFGVASIGKPKLRTLLLLAIALENVLNQHSDFMIREDHRPLLKLEEVFDGFSERTDLIAINSGQNPAPMYFTHRKGWVASNEQLSDPSFLTNLQQRGCKYLLVLKRAFGSDLPLDYPVVFDDENYRVYSLSRLLKASA